MEHYIIQFITFGVAIIIGYWLRHKSVKDEIKLAVLSDRVIKQDEFWEKNPKLLEIFKNLHKVSGASMSISAQKLGNPLDGDAVGLLWNNNIDVVYDRQLQMYYFTKREDKLSWV
jgi:hypothetical protein